MVCRKLVKYVFNIPVSDKDAINKIREFYILDTESQRPIKKANTIFTVVFPSISLANEFILKYGEYREN